MAENEELTPEEKLLRVIQKGDNASPKADPVGDKADPSDSGVPSEVTAVSSATQSSGRGVAMLNRILGLAAVLFILLAGYETYLNLPVNATVYSPQELVFGERPDDSANTSISDIRDMFEERRMFGKPEHPDITPVNTNTVFLGWRAYARENLSLMGMSDVKREQGGIEQIVREAIVMDNKKKQMHFLTAGKTLMLAEQQVTVASVEEAAVELKKGDEVLKIE